MTTTQEELFSIMGQWRERASRRGLAAVTDDRDAGVMRLFRIAQNGGHSKLVGMLVIRNGVVTYAELDGAVFDRLRANTIGSSVEAQLLDAMTKRAQR